MCYGSKLTSTVEGISAAITNPCRYTAVAIICRCTAVIACSKQHCHEHLDRPHRPTPIYLASYHGNRPPLRFSSCTGKLYTLSSARWALRPDSATQLTRFRDAYKRQSWPVICDPAPQLRFSGAQGSLHRSDLSKRPQRAPGHPSSAHSQLTPAQNPWSPHSPMHHATSAANHAAATAYSSSTRHA